MQESRVLSLSYGQVRIKPAKTLHGLVPDSFETYQIIEPGDIICRPTDLQNDQHSLRFGISHHSGIITSAYLCLQAVNGLTPEYGHFVLHTYDLKKIFYGLGSGLRQNLDWSDFKYLHCPIPPLNEQNAIVRYLDRADERIDRYIRAKERLIILLEEQRQAVIDETIMRGLNPDVPLEPSGIPWLGVVPAHWQTRRLRSIAKMRVSNVDKHSKDNEEPIRLCNYTDVYYNDQITHELSFMKATASKDEIRRFRLKPNDVLITKDSEAWDDIAVPALVQYATDDLVCGYHLAILRPSPAIEGSYLACVLQSRPISYQFQIQAKGVTRFGLSHNAIMSARLPLPPLEEQAAIARFLTESITRINQSISNVCNQLVLIHEYRHRLIADVVTGQVDVREAVAGLPSEIQ